MFTEFPVLTLEATLGVVLPNAAALSGLPLGKTPRSQATSLLSSDPLITGAMNTKSSGSSSLCVIPTIVLGKGLPPMGRTSKLDFLWRQQFDTLTRLMLPNRLTVYPKRD